MAHGFNSVVLKRTGEMAVGCKGGAAKNSIGSRRIFAPHFKLQVLDSYRNDADCKGNQRATARKYGIHRRQIQKWLQVEGNLRSSVGSGGGRLGGPKVEQNLVGISGAVEQQAQQRVPELSPQGAAPLDCSTAARRAAEIASPHVASPEAPPPLSPASDRQWRTADSMVISAPCGTLTHAPDALSASDPAAPIDLSLKRPAVVAPGGAPATCPPSPPSPRTPSPPSLAQQQQHHQQQQHRPQPDQNRPHPDVWDLSKKRKCDSPPDPPAAALSPSHPPRPVKLFKPYLDDISSSSSTNSSTSSCGSHIEDVVLMPSSGHVPQCCAPHCTPFHCPPEHNNNNSSTYSLNELHPSPSSITYYYTTFPGSRHPSEYEVLCTPYPDDFGPQTTFKQRHSYSLDFKLSAINCYYEDSMCRGNQRAVATKYNIHRRQVQKWLKQADELRQKNENIKHQMTVR